VIFRTQYYICVINDSLSVVLITTTTRLTDAELFSTPYEYYLDKSSMFLFCLLPYIISWPKSRSRKCRTYKFASPPCSYWL